MSAGRLQLGPVSIIKWPFRILMSSGRTLVKTQVPWYRGGTVPQRWPSKGSCDLSSSWVLPTLVRHLPSGQPVWPWAVSAALGLV
jgi:hypothetical protein